MKIAVFGLWHLGTVTAACLAKKEFEVIAYDSDSTLIDKLKSAEAPLYEPQLNELIADGLQANRLTFTHQPDLLSTVDFIWITFDTPVDDNDIADVPCVMANIKSILPFLKENSFILISSQLPVGTTRKLSTYCKEHYPHKNITFGVSPENLRLGKAIEVFMQPERIIVGIEHLKDKMRIESVLSPFSANIIWMSIESAEMTKHALNAFLATSVIFINEIATLCEKVGANAKEVECGLKSENRIGPKAYLKPGHAIAGGTLARDVNYLIEIGQHTQSTIPLLNALPISNLSHQKWSLKRIANILNPLKNKTIAVLGLAYKAGTDTLRRSSAVEACLWLKEQGMSILAYDPTIKVLPNHLNFIQLKNSLEEALINVDGILVATDLPEFQLLNPDALLKNAKQPAIFDAGGTLAKIFTDNKHIRYFSVGSSS